MTKIPALALTATIIVLSSTACTASMECTVQPTLLTSIQDGIDNQVGLGWNTYNVISEDYNGATSRHYLSVVDNDKPVREILVKVHELDAGYICSNHALKEVDAE